MTSIEKAGAAARLSLPGERAAEFLQTLLPAARLRHDTESAGRSRLGGSPVMREEWPSWDGVDLTFLALLDLEDFVGVDTGLSLPSAGLLNFFFEAGEQMAWGFDPDHANGSRVIYTPPGDGQDVLAPHGTKSFQPIHLRVERVTTVPDMFESVMDPLIRDHEESLQRICDELREEGWPTNAVHQVGGWPSIVQSPFWLECQLASNGLYLGGPEGYKDPRVKDLASGSSDWQLLFQIDTDETVDWMWGDVGMLYFAIRKQDLSRLDFTRTWTILQCG